MPSSERVRWGVLGAARIALRKVIPAMQRGAHSIVTAMASRDEARATAAARELGIAKVHATYDQLLADSDVDAVYIPLPNHLHVPWSIRAADHGKHVLCEKPIALSASEAEALLEVRDRTGVLIQEAFMIRAHPQWITAVDLARGGRIGEVRAVLGSFSYFNMLPDNIRNHVETGGGGLLDIGCYLVHAARWVLGREPTRVSGVIERDPRFGIDRIASFALDFGSAHALGMCATQLAPYQRVHIIGTAGRIEIEIPFNAPPDRGCRLFVDDGSGIGGTGITTIDVEPCDQYTLQGDAFSRAIRGEAPQLLPLEDSVANMRVLDAVLRAAAEPGGFARVGVTTAAQGNR